MMSEYKKKIVDILDEMEEVDEIFLIQIYILLKQHISKKRRT